MNNYTWPMKIAETSLSKPDLPLGKCSKDGSAVVGRDGYLFVLGGSNNLLSLYFENPDEPIFQTRLKGWLNVLQRRKAEMNQRKVDYFQIIVPEKSSILPEYFPYDITGCTPFLSILESTLKNKNCHHYLSCLSAITADDRRIYRYRKDDSHLTPEGALTIFSAILRGLNHPYEDSCIFDRSVKLNSDLGAKFCPPTPPEEVFFPRIDKFADLESGLSRQSLFVPPEGQHVGITSVWRNDTSVIPLRVIAFGNSFFERGATAANLSWWGARWFEEFHFVWSPKVLYDYIDKVSPHLVICQTVERFLTMVPAA